MDIAITKQHIKIHLTRHEKALHPPYNHIRSALIPSTATTTLKQHQQVRNEPVQQLTPTRSTC